MKPLILLPVIILFISINSTAQDYTDYMEQGKYYFNKERYISALQKFDLAYENANSDIRKKDAKNWKKNSIKNLETQQTKMKRQLKSNEHALNYSQKLLDVFYFYDNKVALAHKNGKYGYIHKNGDIIIPFKYDQASHFEESNGFAKASRNGEHFLVDTAGREYLLASNSQSLNGKVEALDLRNQHLSELPEYVFDYVGLKVLLLSNNNLSKLTGSITRLTELTHLDASNNKILSIPDKISELLKLEQLSLQNNLISRLPEDIVFVKNLKKLDLTNNKLFSLPGNMGSLYYLSVLKLDGNRLNTLPKDIGHLRNLRVLSLKNNSLVKIPSGISSLYRLESLQLDQNNITDLPLEISRLPELKDLSLSRNKLAYLPMEIKQLASLRQLDLQGNPIPQTKKTMIEGWLPNCTILF